MSEHEAQRSTTATTLPIVSSQQQQLQLQLQLQQQSPPMDNERAVTYLDSLLGRTLRVHTSDERLFVGEFKCTDRDRNIILGLTHEYRYPTASSVNSAAAAATAAGAVPSSSSSAAGGSGERNDVANGSDAVSTNESEAGSASPVATALAASCQTQAVLKVNMTNRFIGLVVLPGEHIVKIEVEG